MNNKNQKSQSSSILLYIHLPIPKDVESHSLEGYDLFSTPYIARQGQTILYPKQPLGNLRQRSPIMSIFSGFCVCNVLSEMDSKNKV